MLRRNIIYNQIAGQRLLRVEMLSDGLFSVVFTLLILSVKVPDYVPNQSEVDLIRSFKQLGPQFLSYILSFITLGVFWTKQATQFHYIKKYDRNLNWITLFFLMVVTIVPFSTEFLNKHIHYRAAIGVYWLNLLLLGSALYIHWVYVERKNYLSLNEENRYIISTAIKKKILVDQVLYAFGALLCFIDTTLSIAFLLVVQFNYALVFLGKGKAHHVPKEEINPNDL